MKDKLRQHLVIAYICGTSLVSVLLVVYIILQTTPFSGVLSARIQPSPTPNLASYDFSSEDKTPHSPTPTHMTIKTNSGKPYWTAVNPTTDPDPIVSCTAKPECGGGTTSMRRSACLSSVCCQVGSRWVQASSNTECSQIRDKSGFYSWSDTPRSTPAYATSAPVQITPLPTVEFVRNCSQEASMVRITEQTLRTAEEMYAYLKDQYSRKSAQEHQMEYQRALDAYNACLEE